MDKDPNRDKQGFWLDRRENRGRGHFRRGPSSGEAGVEQCMRDWYGDEQGTMEILEHQSPGCPVADALSKVMRRLGREVNYQLAGLQEAWTELVGKDNARHTRPVTCADGTVRVEVDDPAWMYALRGGREREIAEAVTRFTKGAVTRVRLVAAGRNPVQRQKRQVRRIGGDTPPGAEPTDE